MMFADSALSRRAFLGGAAVVSAGVAGCARSQAQPTDPITPEMFGAKGDGRTNDSAALAAMAAHVNARGGGEVIFRAGATYLVGMQRASAGGDNAYESAPLMEFAGLAKPLTLRGNGARIKCAPGLRYGTFDPHSGDAVRRPLPNYRRGESATPYRWMISVSRCSAAVEIADLELDGSLDALLIGGPWGDTGLQIPAYGIGLYDNVGTETLHNIHTHHHGLDGLVIDGVDRKRPMGSTFKQVRSEYNGRQGCSVVGGHGYRFVGCSFNHTGRSRVATSPAAGCDIEAEGNKTVRDLAFEHCEFINNVGCGMDADSGDSAGARFTDCKFVGTTSWSVWPRKPSFRFEGCTFVGALVNAYGDAAHPALATQFVGCTFRDDPSLSPTGKVYRGENSDGPVADLSDSRNVRFSRCRFLLTHAHTLPWSTGAIYADCTMRQASPRTAYPRGAYTGTNSIVGKVELNGSTVSGVLTVNGVRVPPTTRGLG
ncbi:MAG: right-handed parallel beta-helix repeat-containing protein [Alphaproteobacteria bacterium]|nr:right-handed parallel beta-helix repeat-containing protein [Alphaproteobacteria bacterium]